MSNEESIEYLKLKNKKRQFSNSRNVWRYIDEFITASQGKLNTIIDIENLLDEEE